MKRYVSLEEISDGKLYKAGDLAKTDCLGCHGCSKCCKGMGESILLDPYDVWQLTTGLARGFQEMMSLEEVGLKVVDGVILPHLKMNGTEEKCSFLNEEGRCSIHSFRPGICRLFPLGRYYDEKGMHYILQTQECDHPKAKIKIQKWLDITDLTQYEAYIYDWHCLLKQAEELQQTSDDPEFGKNLNLYLLKTFYMAPYEKEDFYGQYQQRLLNYRRIVH